MNMVDKRQPFRASIAGLRSCKKIQWGRKKRGKTVKIKKAHYSLPHTTMPAMVRPIKRVWSMMSENEQIKKGLVTAADMSRRFSEAAYRQHRKNYAGGTGVCDSVGWDHFRVNNGIMQHASTATKS